MKPKPHIQRTVADLVEALCSPAGRIRKCSVLVGAGCSISAGIPSANTIIQRIKSSYPAAYRRASPPDYAGCMAALERGVRRDLIGSYIDHAKVNWAHIALAQLVANGYVDRVLTTNFDPLVSRACALINCFPAVYDFAASHQFNPDQVSDRSIFHLHGQRDGFVLLNTRDEVNQHRRYIKPVFEDAHKGRTWIVVGYSGENDPVFDLLANVDTFEYGLYWIGYGHTPPEHLSKRLLSEHRGTHFLGDWDADDFFVTLTQKLGCFPPDLVTKPFSHLKSLLATLQDYKAPRHNTDGDNTFRSSRYDVASIIRPVLDALISTRENALSAEYFFLAGEYERVVSLFNKRRHSSLSPREKDTYGSCRMMLGDQLHTKAKLTDDLGLYREAAKHFSVAAKLPNSEVGALFNWGNVLFDQSLASRNGAPEVMTRLAEVLLLKAVSKYKAAIAIEPNFADAHNNLANALSDLARAGYPEKDNGVLREAFVHYEVALRDTRTPAIVHNNYAKSLHQLARITNDLALFKKAMVHFKKAGNYDPNYYSVYLSWGHALADMARRTKSPKDYHGAFDKYRRAGELDSSGIAAHHSWYYTLLELTRLSKGKKKTALLSQANQVFDEQKRRRRLNNRRAPGA